MLDTYQACQAVRQASVGLSLACTYVLAFFPRGVIFCRKEKNLYTVLYVWYTIAC